MEGTMTRGLCRPNRNLLFGTCAIGLLASGLSEAKAQDLKAMQSQIEAMQAQIKALQKQVEQAQAQATTAKSAAASAPKSDIDLKVKWKGAPELSSGNGKFKMKIRGRVEADYNKANQDTRITIYHSSHDLHCGLWHHGKKGLWPRRSRRSTVCWHSRVRVMPPATDRFVAWCKQEQASIEQELELITSGKVRIGEDIGSGWIDKTEEAIERAKRRLAQL